MTVSKRLWGAVTVVVVVAVVVAWIVYRNNRVDDPADAQCVHPPVTIGDRQDRGDHQELEVRFGCEGASLAGTIYLPESSGRHPAAVWVHGAGGARRLGWGGQLLPGLVGAGVVVLSYDKRGVGQSEGECCPGDTGHFNLLTADAVGAVQALRTLPQVDPALVGLVGASQAGWIVPRAAVDSDAAFVALAAAPTIAERTSNLYERLAAGEDGELSREQIAERLRDEGSKGYDPKPDLAAMTVPALWEFGTADKHTPVEQSVQVLQELKQQGHDFTVMTFPGAGHGLLDNPPADPNATPSLIAWITRHDR
jgi:dipeptidyl aminopeptidase/acylaminoacyl peptidase